MSLRYCSVHKCYSSTRTGETLHALKCTEELVRLIRPDSIKKRFLICSKHFDPILGDISKCKNALPSLFLPEPLEIVSQTDVEDNAMYPLCTCPGYEGLSEHEYCKHLTGCPAGLPLTPMLVRNRPLPEKKPMGGQGFAYVDAENCGSDMEATEDMSSHANPSAVITLPKLSNSNNSTTSWKVQLNPTGLPRVQTIPPHPFSGYRKTANRGTQTADNLLSSEKKLRRLLEAARAEMRKMRSRIKFLEKQHFREQEVMANASPMVKLFLKGEYAKDTKKNARRWTDADINTAIELYKENRQQYKLMAKTTPLPSRATLKRLLRKEGKSLAIPKEPKVVVPRKPITSPQKRKPRGKDKKPRKQRPKKERVEGEPIRRRKKNTQLVQNPDFLFTHTDPFGTEYAENMRYPTPKKLNTVKNLYGPFTLNSDTLRLMSFHED